MTETELAAMHLRGFTNAYEAVQAQMKALRQEVYVAMKRAADAEASRDMIRAHAQAGLDKYRAQDKLLGGLRAILTAAIDANDCDDDVTAVLEQGREFLTENFQVQLLKEVRARRPQTQESPAEHARTVFGQMLADVQDKRADEEAPGPRGD